MVFEGGRKGKDHKRKIEELSIRPLVEERKNISTHKKKKGGGETNRGV